MSENERKRSAVAQFAAGRAPEPEETDDWLEEPKWAETYRRTWRVARPRGREDIMLDCRASSGHRQAFGYMLLASIIYEPGTTISMLFGETIVTLTGRNLDRLYDALVQHRVPYVQEGNEAEGELKPEDEPHIESLSIKENDESGNAEETD